MRSEGVTATGTALPLRHSAEAVGDLLAFPAPIVRRVSASDVRLALCALLRIGDAGVAVSAGFVSYWLRHDFVDLPPDYGFAILLGALFTVNAMSIAGLYRFENLKAWQIQARGAATAWASVIAVLIALAYFMKVSDGYSRAWLAQWFLLGLMGFLAIRALILLLIAHWGRQGYLALRIGVIDLGDGSRMVERLSVGGRSEIEIVGIFAEPGADAQGAGVRTFGELTALASRGLIDEIVVVRREAPVPEAIVGSFANLSVNVRLWSDVPGSRRRGGPDAFGVATMPTLCEQPVSGWNGLAKRLEDLLLSLSGFIVAAPAMAIIALAIRLDSPGPILYRQERFGFNGNRFKVLKFRTMAASSSHEPVEQARRQDPRVTRIGRLLRRTSLDELPQLWNVVRGDMSLVGPRPHAVSHNEHYAGLIDGYLSRHRVKPGITGWAQVNGLRGETDTLEKMQKRVEHDLYYIDNWSLLFDIKILLRTFVVGFVHRNAY
jgi:Undecaprenyl-phosphate glucose phosphotransferase